MSQHQNFTMGQASWSKLKNFKSKVRFRKNRIKCIGYYICMFFNRRMTKRYAFTHDNRARELEHTRALHNGINYFKVNLQDREFILGSQIFNAKIIFYRWTLKNYWKFNSTQNKPIWDNFEWLTKKLRTNDPRYIFR